MLEPNFLLGLITVCGSSIAYLFTVVISANDRFSAEKKELNKEFSQIYSRLDSGDRRIDSIQSSISHRLDLQEQKIGMTLESIMVQMKTLSQQLVEIQHQLAERPLK